MTFSPDSVPFGVRFAAIHFFQDLLDIVLFLLERDDDVVIFPRTSESKKAAFQSTVQGLKHQEQRRCSEDTRYDVQP